MGEVAGYARRCENKIHSFVRCVSPMTNENTERLMTIRKLKTSFAEKDADRNQNLKKIKVT